MRVSANSASVSMSMCSIWKHSAAHPATHTGRAYTRLPATTGRLGNVKEGKARPTTAPRTTILEKLGGNKALVVAADRFYQRVMADPAVNPFFANTDMKVQRAKQVKFLAFALGGSEGWKGKSMAEAHAGMDLSDEHVDAIANHLEATLVELQVPADVILDAMHVVEGTRGDIVHQ